MEIPTILQNKSFRFVKIRPKQKAPFENSWQKTNNYSFDDKLLLSHIELKGNYGLVTGFGNLCVIDFDDEEYQNKIIPLLPNTFTVQSGGGLKHLYFYLEGSKKSWKISDSKLNKTYLDFQCEGKQIVAPNSIHPNGNSYKVIENIPIKTINISEIKAIITSVFEECYIPKDWIKYDTKDMKKGNNGIVADIKRYYNIKDLLNDQGINTNNKPTKCPLHNNGEKCFSFNDEIWHCFHSSCEKSGDVITLYQEIYGLDFKKAIKELCEKLNIDYKAFEMEKERFSKEIIKANDRLENMRLFISKNPIFYDKSKIWWIWSFQENRWLMVDKTDILNSVRKELEINTVNSKTKNEIIESLKQLGREKTPLDPPLEWIQFKNYIYDISTGKKFPVSNDYFFTNPIQWDLGEEENTPVMDKLFIDWVGEENKQMLYEIIAYCLYRDYPIHRIFCFTGVGRNGKSKYLGLVKRFIGCENNTSTELDILINNRFESSKLYKKLVCQLGETNDNALQNTALLKKLCGQDTIGYEFKNKNPFDDINYAKMIIATNSLPTTLDKSDGFYRRWLIIDFPNQFPEGKDILATIPTKEYENLTLKCVKFLKNILNNGRFTNEPTIEEKINIYESKSNPIMTFIKKNCSLGEEKEVEYYKFKKQLRNWLKDNRHKDMSDIKIGKTLKNEGYQISDPRVYYYQVEEYLNGNLEKREKKGSKRYVSGLCLLYSEDSNIDVVNTDNTDNTNISTSFTYRKRVENCVLSVLSVLLEAKEEVIIKTIRSIKIEVEYPEFDKIINKMKEEGIIYEIKKGIYKKA